MIVRARIQRARGGAGWYLILYQKQAAFYADPMFWYPTWQRAVDAIPYLWRRA